MTGKSDREVFKNFRFKAWHLWHALVSARPFVVQLLAAAFVFAIGCVGIREAAAQTSAAWTTTTGGGDGLWSNTNNWIGGTLPTGGTTTTLTFGKPRGRDKLATDNVIDQAEMHTDATLLHDLFKRADYDALTGVLS